MAEALKIIEDCKYETYTFKKERTIKKEISKFISQYERILQWIIEHAKTGMKTSQYRQELEVINSCNDDGESYFYHFIRKLISLKFKLKTLRRIIFTLKSTNMSTFGKYLLSNLQNTPYDFINIEYQLISFEKAEKLNETYEINAPLEIRTNAWVYDLFLKGTRLYYEKASQEIKIGKKDNSAFYLEKEVVQLQYGWFLLKNKFIKKPKMTHSLLRKLKKAVITYKNNKKYYTTDEFMNLEKKLGDMILDLYHEESTDDVAVSEEKFRGRKIPRE